MSRAWVIIKRIARVLKYLLVLLVLSICIFLLWRALFSTETPKSLKYITPNESLSSLYAEKGDDIDIIRQNYDPITRSEKANGYFSVPTAIFIPEINQAQIVFRYNNSTVRRLAKDYSLAQVPDRNQTLYDVSLALYIDLTPDNTEDNTKKNEDGTPNPNIKIIRIHPNQDSILSERTSLYSFYRYTFDIESEGLSFSALRESGALLAVHVDVYYNEDINYENDPYGALLIYTDGVRDIPVKLEAKDKKALEE